MTSADRGRVLIELLLADQRLTLEELFQMRALLSDSPGGSAQTRLLPADRVLRGDRRHHVSRPRAKSPI